MPRKTKTITFSLPPDMAEQVRDVMRNEGRTMSELITRGPPELHGGAGVAQDDPKRATAAT